MVRVKSKARQRTAKRDAAHASAGSAGWRALARAPRCKLPCSVVWCQRACRAVGRGRAPQRRLSARRARRESNCRTAGDAPAPPAACGRAWRGSAASPLRRAWRGDVPCGVCSRCHRARPRRSRPWLRATAHGRSRRPRTPAPLGNAPPTRALAILPPAWLLQGRGPFGGGGFRVRGNVLLPRAGRSEARPSVAERMANAAGPAPPPRFLFMPLAERHAVLCAGSHWPAARANASSTPRASLLC